MLRSHPTFHPYQLRRKGLISWPSCPQDRSISISTQATLFRAMEGATNPSVETLRSLAAVHRESTLELPELDEDVERWLLAFAREALGLSLTSI